MKMLIVDDKREKLAFDERLKAWQEEGFEVTATAVKENEVIKEICDFYLLDVRMPEGIGEHRKKELVTEEIFKACGADMSSDFTKKLMAYFGGHNDINLKDIAEEFELSKDYFGRLFKRKMKINFYQFALKYKMEYAKYLLDNSDAKVYEIGERLGLKTADYFTKLFKEYTGMTPAEYRKK